MGPGLSCSQQLQVRQSLRLSQSQRLQLQAQSLGLRLRLIHELHGERYEPKAQCPNCLRDLTAVEIISGFNRDPKDFTTRCTKCGKRFQPRLVCFNDVSRTELPFYCDVQTLDQMRGKETMTMEQFSKEHPAIYRSAIVHHGSLSQAFKKIGINYPFKEIPDWRNKIRGFLGRLPDTTIAKCVNVSTSVIRKIRKESGTPRFLKSEALKETEG